MMELKECRLCPRNCGVDRNTQKGYCKAGKDIIIGRYSRHEWEEPPISGKNGSGTVFFSFCSMGCVFCQNYEISTLNHGKTVSNEELSDIFLELQEEGVHNINLVTPTHYSVQIKKALEISKNQGLKIPIVYNCGGYESVEALKMLEGLIDIYMPDVKYFDDKYSVKYSNAPKYFKYASAALDEMYSQVGKCQFDEVGIMKKGLLVRHMLLPGLLFDSKKIIDYLYKTFGDNIYISLMSQYTPTSQLKNYPEINRKISAEYYNALVDYAQKIGVVNAFVQEGSAAAESFIPSFYRSSGDLLKF